MTPTIPLHHLFGAGGPLARGGLVRHRRSKRAYFMGPTASTPVRPRRAQIWRVRSTEP
nr:MAG TPA: hypothetical protein [Caudoviricetes sp.]